MENGTRKNGLLSFGFLNHPAIQTPFRKTMLDQFVQLFREQSFRYASELFAFCESAEANISLDARRSEVKLTCSHYERIYRTRSESLSRRFAGEPYWDELRRATDDLCAGLSQTPHSPCFIWVIEGHAKYEYVAFENTADQRIAGCLRFDRTVGKPRRNQTKTNSPMPDYPEFASVVRKLLWRDWDPVRVNHMPEVEDEYDSYVGGICDLLRAGCDSRKLRQHLAHIETVNMGLSTTSARIDDVVLKLLSLSSKNDE